MLKIFTLFAVLLLYGFHTLAILYIYYQYAVLDYNPKYHYMYFSLYPIIDLN